MKLPRDLASGDLEKALRRAFGYQFTRQVGSHRRLTTQTGGEHHITIPNHDPLPACKRRLDRGSACRPAACIDRRKPLS